VSTGELEGVDGVIGFGRSRAVEWWSIGRDWMSIESMLAWFPVVTKICKKKKKLNGVGVLSVSVDGYLDWWSVFGVKRCAISKVIDRCYFACGWISIDKKYVKTPIFPIKNTHFPIKNTPFPIKNTPKYPYFHQKWVFSHQKHPFFQSKTPFFAHFPINIPQNTLFSYQKYPKIPPKKPFFLSKTPFFLSKTPFFLSGDLLRAEVAAGTPLGSQIKAAMAGGWQWRFFGTILTLFGAFLTLFGTFLTLFGTLLIIFGAFLVPFGALLIIFGALLIILALFGFFLFFFCAFCFFFGIFLYKIPKNP
jgi:hypothetical protein